MRASSDGSPKKTEPNAKKKPVVRLRFILLIILALFGVWGYYSWYDRTMLIQGVPVLARMVRAGFARQVVAIQPMGKVNAAEIEPLKELFQVLYQIEVKILDPVEIPQNAFIPERKQFNAGIINHELAGKRGNYFRLLAVIDQDMTIADYNFVFGAASLNNGVATISLIRLQEAYYGQNPDVLAFRSRLFKIILHEYGHTFGLGHCEENGPCLMCFIHHIGDLDDFSCGFCWVCNRSIVLDQ